MPRVGHELRVFGDVEAPYLVPEPRVLQAAGGQAKLEFLQLGLVGEKHGVHLGRGRDEAGPTHRMISDLIDPPVGDLVGQLFTAAHVAWVSRGLCVDAIERVPGIKSPLSVHLGSSF